MKSRSLASLVLLALCVAPSEAARALPVVDQENLAPWMLGGRIGTLSGQTFDVAQVFEVGMAGTLAAIEVYLARRGSPDDITLEIRGTTAGVPDPSGGLGFVTHDASAVTTSGGLVRFDLQGLGIPVSVGDVLSFVLSSPQDFTGNVHEYGAYFSLQDYVPGGSFHGDVDGGTASPFVPDTVFRTFVEPVPEASTLTLVALGFGAAGVMRRGRPRARASAKQQWRAS